MSKLRVGVVGLGMGSHHARCFHKHPQAEVIALVDMNEERLDALGDELKVDKRYRDADAMLNEVPLDIVAVATPNNLHKPVTMAAFEAGCHVLCEKPMAMNAQEGREMVDAARRADRRLMINFSFRFTPQSWALKKEVDAGTLGEIYFARTFWLRRHGLPGLGGWFGQKALSGGGPLIDLGVHRLDLALWLMGYPRPTWVLAATYDHIASSIAKKEGKPFDVEDLAAAFVRFENGASLELTASWAGHIKERELMETRLLGTQGGLVQRNEGEGYQFDAEIFTDRGGCPYDLRPHEPVPGALGPMDHFVDCILNDKPHTATGEEGLIVMELLDAVYESARRGEPVRVCEP